MNEEIRQRTKWFMEDRFGMFIHWGLYSIPACGEWMMSQKEMTIEEYSKYFDQFDPVDYDPKKWVRLAKKAGMKYVVLTANKHKSRQRPGKRICRCMPRGRIKGWSLFFHYRLASSGFS